MLIAVSKTKENTHVNTGKCVSQSTGKYPCLKRFVKQICRLFISISVTVPSLKETIVLITNESPSRYLTVYEPECLPVGL